MGSGALVVGSHGRDDWGLELEMCYTKDALDELVKSMYGINP